jgi:hypothetical protein
LSYQTSGLECDQANAAIDMPRRFGADFTMPTQLEVFADAPAAASKTSQKLLALLRKRLRQLLRAALGLVLAAGVFAIWWVTSLNGLPDIGDPFDVDAIRSFRIPDDENALTFLRRAQEMLILMPELPRVVRATAPTVGWSQADPKLRAWVEANLPAFELFQQGADQTDGAWQPSGQLYWQNYPMINHGGLMWVALLEGGRRQENGDLAGAWNCYRAVLRMTTHIRRRGRLDWRLDLNVLHAALRQRLLTWATDPKTTIPQLRRALDEAVLSQPKPEWDAFSLKLEYLELNRQLEPSGNQIHDIMEQDLPYRLGELEVPPHLAEYLYAGNRFLKHEPQRSQRALRLLFANWLAHVQIPELRQKRPAVRALISLGASESSIPLYPVSPLAPADARVISPHEVANWLVSANDIKILLFHCIWPFVFKRELSGHRELIISLAGELYRRERGAIPPSEKSLVGTYLSPLPDDVSADDDDGTAPTVGFSRVTDKAQPK